MTQNELKAATLGEDSLFGDGFDEMDDDFDPLAADDLEIDQEDMDDENPYDTVDYPTMREMPEHMQREAVYTPEVQGSAEAAIRELFDHNPARRVVFLGIIDACRNGCATSAVAERIDAIQADNRSVYAPTTLCRMLERAGALEFEEPVVSTEQEDVAEGVEYLEINETIDPMWTSTPIALEIYDELAKGAPFRDIVLDRDSKYLDVYRAVLSLVAVAPRQRAEIEQLVDTFDIVQTPRRFGGHFIDMLERTDAIAWKDNAWTMTELGRNFCEELGCTPSGAEGEQEAERA